MTRSRCRMHYVRLPIRPARLWALVTSLERWRWCGKGRISTTSGAAGDIDFDENADVLSGMRVWKIEEQQDCGHGHICIPR